MLYYSQFLSLNVGSSSEEFLRYALSCSRRFFVQGVPPKIKIGPRDVPDWILVISRSDVPGNNGKFLDVQLSLVSSATPFRDGCILLLKLSFLLSLFSVPAISAYKDFYRVFL